MAATQNQAADDDLVKLAAEAYVYGYPLVYDLAESAGFVSGTGHFAFQAPINSFGHARDLLGPETKFVSPNNDTNYSLAVCDVRKGPLVLHVPDTVDRYYVLQFVDAWSNNFAYVGRRATGTKEGTYLLAAHDYDGDVPGGATVIHAPTGVFTIVGRIAVNGKQDLPNVHALQDQFTLAPLHADAGTPDGIPAPDPRVGEDLIWWETFRVALAAFPPPSADAEFLEVCAALGLLEAESPFADVAEDRKKALVTGRAAGQAAIEKYMQQLHRTPQGWNIVEHVFDYNLDYFELGTLDAPEWRIADRKTAYVTRAVAARAGLWGNHGYEALYAIVGVDADGNALDGSNRYELRLPSAPPADAFWSLTMYDVPDFYLVANAINRYSIGDRTPGLTIADDGSITLYLQTESPGADKESNWLPAPTGPFRPILRLYQPREEILDGSYVLPGIRKVG